MEMMVAPWARSRWEGAIGVVPTWFTCCWGMDKAGEGTLSADIQDRLLTYRFGMCHCILNHTRMFTCIYG